MKEKRIGIILVAGILLFSFVILSSCGKKKVVVEEIEEVIVEEVKPVLPKAPDFTLDRIGGRTFTLSRVKGEAIILNFWHTHSPDSKKEIPELIKLYDKYRDKGLEIIGISLNQDDESAVIDYSNAVGINYPLCIADNKIIENYQPGIPTTWILNGNHEIVKKIIGRTSAEELSNEIDQLVSFEEVRETKEMRP